MVLLLKTGLRISELCALDLGDVGLSERKGTVKVRQAKRPDSEARAIFIGKRLERLQPRGVQRMLAEFGRRAGVGLLYTR